MSLLCSYFIFIQQLQSTATLYCYCVFIQKVHVVTVYIAIHPVLALQTDIWQNVFVCVRVCACVCVCTHSQKSAVHLLYILQSTLCSPSKQIWQNVCVRVRVRVHVRVHVYVCRIKSQLYSHCV